MREKLNLNYGKSYLRFNESPEDAEEQLKEETSKIDFENEDTAVLDESGV